MDLTDFLIEALESDLMLTPIENPLRVRRLRDLTLILVEILPYVRELGRNPP